MAETKTYLVEVEAFYPGEHPAADGPWIYTLAELELCALQYNKRVSEGGNLAPVVLGHPENNSPKFGQVEKAYIKDRALWLTCRISAKLFGWIEEGYYGERSIYLEVARDKRTGVYFLDIFHIGFLGGNAPALGQLQQDGLPIPDDWKKEPLQLYDSVRYYSLSMKGGGFALTNKEKGESMNEELKQEIAEVIANSMLEVTAKLKEIDLRLGVIEEEVGIGKEKEEPEEPEAASATPTDEDKSGEYATEIQNMKTELAGLRLESATERFSQLLNSEDITKRTTEAQRKSAMETFVSLAKRGAAFSSNKSGEVEHTEETKGLLSMLRGGAVIVNLESNAFSRANATENGDGDMSKMIEKIFAEKSKRSV